MSIQKDIEDEKIYQGDKKQFEEMITNIEDEINKINNSERNSIIEFEIFLKIIQNAHKYYKKANYVQKRKITNIIILNIIINAKKQVKIEVHNIFRRLFSCNLPLTIELSNQIFNIINSKESLLNTIIYLIDNKNIHNSI